MGTKLTLRKMNIVSHTVGMLLCPRVLCCLQAVKAKINAILIIYLLILARFRHKFHSDLCWKRVRIALKSVYSVESRWSLLSTWRVIKNYYWTLYSVMLHWEFEILGNCWCFCKDDKRNWKGKVYFSCWICKLKHLTVHDFIIKKTAIIQLRIIDMKYYLLK